MIDSDCTCKPTVVQATPSMTARGFEAFVVHNATCAGALAQRAASERPAK